MSEGVLARAFRRGRVRLKQRAYSGFRRDRWQLPDRIVETLALPLGARVADLGAGGGYFTFRLARAVGPSGRVYAVDTDLEMLLSLAERAAEEGLANVAAVEAVPGDPCLPEEVDMVFVSDAYHHIPERERYFARLREYLTEEGRVVIIEPRRVGLHRVFGHATDAETIRSELGRAGLRLVVEHDFLPRQSFLVFA